MNLKQVMARLKSLGREQTRKTYRRHGADGDLFGVSFADFYKIQKEIKVDHPLALQLWKTRNVDARILATLIADPEKMDRKTCVAWLKEIGYYFMADMLSMLVARAPNVDALMKKWMQSKQEYMRQTGYDVLCHRLRLDSDCISDAEGRAYLKTIRKEIHGSPNRARHTMVMAMISIGAHLPNVRKAAIETMKKVGKVEVDHGDTACKTPDPIPYLRKAAARFDKRRKKRGAKHLARS